MIDILDLTNRDKLWLPSVSLSAKELNLEKKTNLTLSFIYNYNMVKKKKIKVRGHNQGKQDVLHRDLYIPR